MLDAYDEVMAVIYKMDESEDRIGAAIDEVYETSSDEALKKLLLVLVVAMKQETMCVVPFNTKEGSLLDNIDIENVKPGDVIKMESDVRIKLDTVVENEDEDEWYYFLTNDSLYRKNAVCKGTISLLVKEMIEMAYKSEMVNGLVINPFSRFIRLDKKMLKVVLDVYDAEEEA